jgi:hypothetical protein
MTFQELQGRLIFSLRERIRSGDLTERGVARITGISQPHIHNVLKGKRYFSMETCDGILSHLHMDLLDLVEPTDLMEWRNRQ